MNLKTRTAVASFTAALAIGAAMAPLASADRIPDDIVAGGEVLTQDGLTPRAVTIGSMDSPVLSIFSTSHTASLVRVQGLIRTTPFDVPGIRVLIDQGYRVQVRIWGDDPVYDDLLRGPVTAEIYPASDGPAFTEGGIGFLAEIPVSNGVLDEDDSIFDDRDEIYAGVRLLDPSGNTIRSGETRRLYGRW
jgi:hypothetical protein